MPTEMRETQTFKSRVSKIFLLGQVNFHFFYFGKQTYITKQIILLTLLYILLTIILHAIFHEISLNV